MRNEAHAAPKFEKGFEAVGWVLVGLLLAGALWLPAAPALQARLLAITAALAALTLLGHRLLLQRSEGALAYRADDKALAIGLGTVVLLTAYLYLLSDRTPSIGYLYLLPMIGATLVLRERVVLGEALASALALLFLHAAARPSGPFWTPEFAVRLIVFSVASACLVAVTAGLRKASADARRLSAELSRRLEQVRVLGSLARQSELTPKLDQLAANAGKIIAEAVGTEHHAIFVRDDDRAEPLRLVGQADGFSETLERGGNAGVLRSVLETGQARVLDGDAAAEAMRARNMLVLPLRVRQSTIGVICLMDRRGDGTFRPEDVEYCGRLATLAASLLNGAVLFRRTLEEKRTVERLAKLLVGREAKMRELKERLREDAI